MSRRFAVLVRTGPGPDDFSPAASFDTAEEAVREAPGIVAGYWTAGTGSYAFLGAILDREAPLSLRKVADVEGRELRVTNFRRPA